MGHTFHVENTLKSHLVLLIHQGQGENQDVGYRERGRERAGEREKKGEREREDKI